MNSEVRSLGNSTLKRAIFSTLTAPATSFKTLFFFKEKERFVKNLNNATLTVKLIYLKEIVRDTYRNYI